IIKVQKQYVPKNQDPSQFLMDILERKPIIDPYYEIIAEVKQKKKREIREFLLTDNGDLLSSRPLKASSYEHILY
ncbi:MAG: hypothetical protein AAF901_10025, partial [Bacteroidota bacterium]